MTSPHPERDPSRSPVVLRLALGIVYFHFGVLKFFPDLSPAELIATQTVMSMSHHLLDATSALWCLAVLETAIGIGLMFNILPRMTFSLFVLHMAGTFMPLFVLPELTFKFVPFAPNTEGQYIFKNIVFVAAGWTVLLPQVLPGWMRFSAAGQRNSVQKVAGTLGVPSAEIEKHRRLAG